MFVAMIVSSAKNTYFKKEDVLVRSWMYNINSKGPRIDPYGTPNATLNISDEHSIK